MISILLHYYWLPFYYIIHTLEDLIATQRGERRPPGGRNVMLEAGGGDW